MRIVTLEDGEEIKVFSLKWKDVRELAADNLTPETILNNNGNLEEKSAEALSRVFAIAFGEDKAAYLEENGTMRDVLLLYKEIWKETRGDPGEEKN